MSDDLLRVGVISNTHGVRGEVKVFPTTDDPNRYKKLKKVILQTRNGTINENNGTGFGHENRGCCY